MWGGGGGLFVVVAATAIVVIQAYTLRLSMVKQLHVVVQHQDGCGHEDALDDTMTMTERRPSTMPAMGRHQPTSIATAGLTTPLLTTTRSNRDDHKWMARARTKAFMPVLPQVLARVLAGMSTRHKQVTLAEAEFIRKKGILKFLRKYFIRDLNIFENVSKLVEKLEKVVEKLGKVVKYEPW
ncbi:hypothetical protein EDB89DRAFT_1915938 [Lactarius sanguifluus]|nr:hypothetical protein EDB89DRAFT_1915938 [Lactarius sanguifluus]